MSSTDLASWSQEGVHAAVLTIGGLDPRGPSVSSFAVLGGTGAYAGASGEATLTDSDEGTRFVIDLA